MVQACTTGATCKGCGSFAAVRRETLYVDRFPPEADRWRQLLRYGSPRQLREQLMECVARSEKTAAFPPTLTKYVANCRKWTSPCLGAVNCCPPCTVCRRQRSDRQPANETGSLRCLDEEWLEGGLFLNVQFTQPRRRLLASTSSGQSSASAGHAVVPLTRSVATDSRAGRTRSF